MRSAILSLVVLMPALAASTVCTTGAINAEPAGSPANEAGLPDRDPELARRLVAEGALLLDVRTPEEFASRHLEGAVNVPVDELDERIHEIDALTGGDKSKPIVVYCRTGRRSAIAKEKLLAAGHERVTNLGGIDDWSR